MRKSQTAALLVITLVTLITLVSYNSNKESVEAYTEETTSNTNIEFVTESAISEFVDSNEISGDTRITNKITPKEDTNSKVNKSKTTDNKDSKSIDNKEDKVVGYIFIGDSRFVGMDTACSISNIDNRFVIAKISQGYKYLVNTAIPKAKEIIRENKGITDWKYVVCLGINDLYNLDKYIKTYTELAKTTDLILVSVNPIEYHDSITNDMVEEFNNKLQKIEGIQYIDSYTTLVNSGFSTADGIHYTNKTYKRIYDIINNSLADIT